jgi:hypothetical protein
MAWKQTAAALAALLWLAPSPSFASPVTINLSFSGSGFVDEYGGATPPYSSISGSFSATFDPTVQYETTTSGLNVRSFTGVPVSSPIAFSYFPADQEFYLGGSLNSAEGIASGTDDFLVALNLSNLSAPQFVNCTDPANDCGTATGNPSVLVTAYTNSGYPNSGFFLPAAGAQLSSVPEPRTFGIVLTGLAVLALARAARLRPDAGIKGLR